MVAVDVRRVTGVRAAVPQDAVLEDAYAIEILNAVEPDITPIAGCGRCGIAIVVRVSAIIVL